MRPVIVADHDPRWPETFEALRAPIWVAVSDVALTIEQVAVRDYLRAHPDVAAQYAALKKRFALQFPKNDPPLLLLPTSGASRLRFARCRSPLAKSPQ